MGEGPVGGQGRGSYSVSGVRRFAILRDHLFGVTVIGGDHEDVTVFLAGFVDGADCLIAMSHSLYGCVVNTCVSHLPINPYLNE